MLIFIPFVSIAQNFTIVDGKNKNNYVKKNKKRSSIIVNMPSDLSTRTKKSIGITLKDYKDKTLKKLSFSPSVESFKIDLDYPLDRSFLFGKNTYYLSINNDDIDTEIIIKTTPICGAICKLGVLGLAATAIILTKGSKNKKNPPLPEPPLPGGN